MFTRGAFSKTSPVEQSGRRFTDYFLAAPALGRLAPYFERR